MAFEVELDGMRDVKSGWGCFLSHRVVKIREGLCVSAKRKEKRVGEGRRNRREGRGVTSGWRVERVGLINEMVWRWFHHGHPTRRISTSVQIGTKQSNHSP